MNWMEENHRRDLVIAGTGSAAGGSYHLVKVSGNGKLSGDLNCVNLKIYGKANIDGNVTAQSTKISGTANINGDLRSEQVKIQGTAEVNGGMTCNDMKLHGNTKIKGNLSGEEIKIEGGTTIAGDCEAEEFFIKGCFSIGGLLNAGHIEIHLSGGCHAKEIGCEKIKVKKPGIAFHLKNLILNYLFQINVGLVTDSIEGDEIYLEHTKAKVVRGNNVTIGPGCEIELVEYKNSFDCDKGSKVNKNQKV
jgi:cytoskeletal protein CcmA (bactofilin family)